MKRQATISSFFSTAKKPRTTTVDNEPMQVEGTPLRPICKKLTEQEKKLLHAQFQQKLGSSTLERQQQREQVERLMSDSTAPPLQKYTPLEKQVVELKQRYPKCLLLIEVGYKFRFFGEDAKIASRILHIANFIDRNFFVASIPVHRLNYHVQKLVNEGYRVGIVRQTETAALKAAGTNRNAPFQRELSQMITKGTMVDDDLTLGCHNYLMCILEEKRGGNGPDERVYTGILAVQPTSGDIIYDCFEDTYMRSELETRLLHLEPNEVLLPDVISKPTEKLVKHQELVRVERMPANDQFCQDYNVALTYVAEFYKRTTSLAAIVELPFIIIKALACMIRYLEEFGLSKVLKVAKFFKSFVTQSHMLLNGNTLVNLEIYRNNTNYKQEGSLFSILNHTRTRFGQRLLRKWVGRPLVDEGKLSERVGAIEELAKTQAPKKQRIIKLFKKLPDLEKGLCRIHYGKSAPAELVQVLDALVLVSSSFNSNEPRLNSPLLNRLFDTLPTISSTMLHFRSLINPTSTTKHDFFQSSDHWPDIPRQKQNIHLIELQLEEHLKEMKQHVSDVKYITIAGIEYLLEVSNKKSVPKEWVKINNTKAVSRYHSPYIIQQLREREIHRELLTLAAEQAYKEFLVEISEKYQECRDVVSCLAQIDCLLSLSLTVSEANYCKPTYGTEINVIDSRHPIIEKWSNYVPNDIVVHSQRAMILTGPNMGGKSSYIRQMALIFIMGQIGSYVPASSAKLSMLDAVYTRMGASDHMMRGKSTFMVELSETAEIMRQATSKSLVILDELGRGTSTHDGQAIAYAVLDYFVQKVRPITLFVTHYPSLGKIQRLFPERVRNCYMSYMEEDQKDGVSHIVFLYKLVDGIAMNSYGMNVARLANIPVSIIQKAKNKSQDMQQRIEVIQSENRNIRIFKNIMQNKPLEKDDLISISHP